MVLVSNEQNDERKQVNPDDAPSTGNVSSLDDDKGKVDGPNETSAATDENNSGTSGETCKIQTDEEVNFQQERENLAWNAALTYLENYKEETDQLISNKEKEMYARQALLKGWNQQVLKKSRIMIAGMSVLGRELVKDMALIGVGSITIVDPAYLENTKKPAFMMPVVAGRMAKVEVIKKQLHALNPFMTVNTIDTRIEDVPLSQLKDHEIIVACMNDFKTRAYIFGACKQLGKPFLEGTCLGLQGFVQAWLPSDQALDADQAFSPTYCDVPEDARSRTNQGAASIIAGTLGQEIIKVAFKLQGGDIGDVQNPRYIQYHGMSGLFEAYPARKDVLLMNNKPYMLDRDALKRSTVFIAGVGALGCEIAKDLAVAGVGKLILVDLDTIETSNLSRQLLFRMEDIGKPKAEVAAKRVKELNPDVETEFHFTKIQQLPLSMYEACDVIIAALDNVQARFDLNVLARRVKRPMIEGGTVGFEGHVQVIVPAGAKHLEETACYRCVVPVPPPDQKLIAACTPKGIPQTREHCVLRAEFIFRKKEEREPDLKARRDVILLTGASNRELDMLKERDPSKDHGPPFILQDMENILENKIPAIQTVSSVIASIESVEAMKMAVIQQSQAKPDHVNVMEPTYMNYNGIWGIFEHLPVLKRDECPVCGTQKGIEYIQIPITGESTVEDIFVSLQKVGTIKEGEQFMVMNVTTKGIVYHPSIPAFSSRARKLIDFGLAPGTDVLLTPFGIPKAEDGSEPLKYQVSFILI